MIINKFKKPMLAITFILSLCILSVAHNSSSTTSAFSDTASINSTLRTASLALNYSGQDKNNYFWYPADKIESVVLDTTSEGLWYPDRPSITKEITVSNAGNIDYYYTLTSYRDGNYVTALDHAIQARMSIDQELAYEGALYNIKTEKRIIKANESQKIKIVMTMESTENDDLYSGSWIRNYIKLDTFLPNKSMSYVTTEIPIAIEAQSKIWRERIYTKNDTSNSEVYLEITKVNNVHNSVLEYSTNSDFTDSVTIPVSHSNEWELDVYKPTLANLIPGTTYYVRTQIENPEFGSGISDVFTFTTLP